VGCSRGDARALNVPHSFSRGPQEGKAYEFIGFIIILIERLCRFLRVALLRWGACVGFVMGAFLHPALAGDPLTLASTHSPRTQHQPLHATPHSAYLGVDFCPMLCQKHLGGPKNPSKPLLLAASASDLYAFHAHIARNGSLSVFSSTSHGLAVVILGTCGCHAKGLI
jgi:hypothetical protein